MSNLQERREVTTEKLNQRANSIFNHLIDSQIILNEHNVPFMCSDGTALGFYRQGWVIDGDSDFDLMVKASDLKANTSILTEDVELNLGRFTAQKRTNILNRVMFIESAEAALRAFEQGNHHPFSIKIAQTDAQKGQGGRAFGDLFVLYDPHTDFENCDLSLFPENCYVYTFISSKRKFVTVPKVCVDNPPTTVQIKGREFPLPANIEQYLVHMYGEHWKIPMVKGWRNEKLYVRMSDTDFMKIRVKHM